MELPTKESGSETKGNVASVLELMKRMRKRNPLFPEINRPATGASTSSSQGSLPLGHNETVGRGHGARPLALQSGGVGGGRGRMLALLKERLKNTEIDRTATGASTFSSQGSLPLGHNEIDTTATGASTFSSQGSLPLGHNEIDRTETGASTFSSQGSLPLGHNEIDRTASRIDISASTSSSQGSLPLGYNGTLDWLSPSSTNGGVGIEYLLRILAEPVHNTETVLDSFSPGMALLTRCCINLGLVKLFIEKSRLSDAYHIACQTEERLKRTETLFTPFEKDLNQALCFILNNLLNRADQAHPSDCAIQWIEAYTMQLFGLHGCRQALSRLQAESNSLESIPAMELSFLRARVLGKLRYFEQWRAEVWLDEESSLRYLIVLNQDTDLKKRAMMYMVDFLKNQGYRHFLQNRKNLNPMNNAHKTTSCYKEATDLLKELIMELDSCPLETKIWLAESLLTMPTRYNGDDVCLELGGKVIKAIQAKLTRTAPIPYFFRVLAKSMAIQLRLETHEKHRNRQMWGPEQELPVSNYQEQQDFIINTLDLAISMNSNIARLEKASFLFSMNRKQDMTPILNSLPDSKLHLAAYLFLCKNKPSEAKALLVDVPKDYPLLLAHYPVCIQLTEPINLASLGDDDSAGVFGGFLHSRSEILEEAQRLLTGRATKNLQRRRRRQ